MSTDVVSDEPLRTAMVERLRDMGAIRRDEVAAAFLRVPRHLFAPEATSLEQAYDVEAVIRTKWTEDGTTISSVSAPQIQARMVEQAGITRGMRVLEIGSGGYNAAVIAELVGPDGQITTCDIDAEVTDRASRLLDEAGYSRVTVVLGDGELGCPQFAPFDAIVVTVEAADVPPAWIEQLVEGGSLVAPLRVRGLTRSIGFTKAGDRLVSTSKELCGFVAMQGAGERPRLWVPLRDGKVRLRFDEEPCPTDPGVLDRAFEAGQAQTWTGVTVRSGESIDTLQTWLATTADGSCLLSYDKDDKELADALADPVSHSMCNAVVDGDSFAYLTRRRPNEDTVELGSRAFGPNADALANTLADLVRAWDRDHRHGPGPQYTIYPAGADAQGLDGPVVTKHHIKIVTVWPQPPSDSDAPR
ncbi:methyltransferase, FxLD system [Streptosporangium lutulentum]|uniref:Protein-L-isoaspartate O-methyltransferase n=1 Tax=Streptosporangium lutulentum TaxID=1461250 RepID=A0ABT9Q8D8_9ACTN|nr:methyltransferase, FxLD system [Streptosporangium lutulentum]MDP9842932.1 protein-L-isoaspartate(D-aspartate) O-methyltransferase [Streptosporangium lutulentum]